MSILDLAFGDVEVRGRPCCSSCAGGELGAVEAPPEARELLTRQANVPLYRAPDLHETPGDVDLGYDAILWTKGARLRVLERRAPEWYGVEVVGPAKYGAPDLDEAGNRVEIAPPAGPLWVRARNVEPVKSGGGLWWLLGGALVAAATSGRGR